MNLKLIVSILSVLMALSAIIMPVSAYDPFVSYEWDKSVVEVGDSIIFSGVSEGSATMIQFFIIGDTLQECTPFDLNSDKTFEIEVDTSNLDPGTYYVIVSNPNVGNNCAITFSEEINPIVYYDGKAQGRFNTFKGFNGKERITSALSNSDDVFATSSFVVKNTQPIYEHTDNNTNNDIPIGTIIIIIGVVVLGLCVILFIVYNGSKNNKNNSNTQPSTETIVNTTQPPLTQQKVEVEMSKEEVEKPAENGVETEKGGFCPDCGKPYKTGVKFCKYCGRKL